MRWRGALRAACASGAALALLAAACGERREPTGPSSTLYPVTVTTGDRVLVVARPPSRIAVLDPVMGRLLAALGARNRIVGSPLGAGGRILLPRLRALRPDLIVAGARTEAELSRAASATGAAVYAAAARSVRDVERIVSQLGLIAGAPVEARRLVRRIQAKRRLVARRIAGRPRVTVFVDLGFFTTAPNHSLIGDLVREAGGDNVAADTPSGVPVDLRQLLALDPEVYVTVSDSGTTLASLRRHRQVRRLRAVRSGRVVTIDASLVQPGPRIGQGLVELARALHPDAFR